MRKWPWGWIVGTLLAGSAGAAFAAPNATLKIQIALQDELGKPVAGALFQGSCRASEEDSFFAARFVNPFACTTDDTGFCSFEVKTFASAPDKLGRCECETASSVTETGKSASASVCWSFAEPLRFIRIQKQTRDSWAAVQYQGYKDQDALDAATGGSLESMASFQDLIQLKDDELEVTAILSSERKSKVKSNRSSHTEFVRALVDKKALKTTYQIQVLDAYHAFGFRNYNFAKFISNGAPKVATASRIKSDVDCATKVDGKCKYQESVSFDLDEKAANELAAMYQPGERSKWRYRISSQSGEDLNLTMPYAELAAMVDRVGQYVAQAKQK